MVTLTKVEEKIMKILWDIEKGFIKDIIDQYPDPKPPYNSVSTIVRVMVQKEIVGYTAYGKSHQYHPLVDKEAYSKKYLNRFVDKYFKGSYKELVSFFTNEQEMSVADLEKLLNELKNKKS